MCDSFSVREVNQVSLMIRNELVKLVGEKPMLSCMLDGKRCDGLWAGFTFQIVIKVWVGGPLFVRHFLGAIPKGLSSRNKAPARHFFENLWGGQEGGPPLKMSHFGLVWGGRPPQAPPPWETL